MSPGSRLAWPRRCSLGPDRRGRRDRGGGQAVQLGELPRAVLHCVLASASYRATEIDTVFRPDRSQAFLTSARTWVDAHTDQAISVGSLLLGFWLTGDSLYLIT